MVSFLNKVIIYGNYDGGNNAKQGYYELKIKWTAPLFYTIIDTDIVGEFSTQ